MSAPDTEQSAKIRRSTMMLVAVALAFYIGFILVGVLNA